MRSERTLDGCSVLVTRPEMRAASLVAALRELGAEVVARATIELVAPADLESPRRAVAAIDEFAWIVFTSAHGVRFFDERFRECHGPSRSVTARVAAVGLATAQEATRRGMQPDVVASESTSEGLGAALSGFVSRGDAVLLVRPEVSRPELPAALRALDARVEEIAFYRNVPARDVAETARAVGAGRFDVVLLTSPSSLARLLDADSGAGDEALGALARVRWVAIGPTTARAVERRGLAVAAVARQPTDEAIVAAIAELFR